MIIQRPTFTPAFESQGESVSCSSSQTSIQHVVLYLLDDGQVLEIGVDSFKSEYLDIGNPTFMDEQWLITENEQVKTQQSALKDILLQPERVLRIAFLTCRYPQDGVFIHSSMRSLLDVIVTKRILLRSKPDIDRFAAERRDAVELNVECFYREDHGDSPLHELTLYRAPRSSHGPTESPVPVVFGALCTDARASGNPRRLQVWAVHTAECAASSTRGAASANVRWDSVFLRNGWIIEAQRLRARLHSQTQDRWAAELDSQLREISHEIQQTLAPQLHSAFADSDQQFQLTNALLRHVRRYAWVIAQRVRCYGDPVERYVRELLGQKTPGCEDTASLDVAVLLKRLRDERRHNVVMQPWLRRLCNALTSDGRGSTQSKSKEVTWYEVELLVRRWRSAFLGIESVSALIVDLGLIPMRESDFDIDVALAVARQQFSAFALSKRREDEVRDSKADIDAEYHAAWTFISPQVVVSFLLQQGNLAGRMERSLDLVRARVEEDRLQSQQQHRGGQAQDPAKDGEEEESHERRYVLMLRRREWRLQLEQLLSRQIRIACLSSSKDADAMWLTRTRSALRQLLLTRLPLPNSVPDYVTVRTPVVTRRLGYRWIVDNVDRNDSVGSGCSLVLRVDTQEPDQVTRWSTELGFLRHIQHFSARRFFLPLVTIDAGDVAIRGVDAIRLTSHLKDHDAPLLALVCDSLVDWRTLSERLALLHRLPTAPQAQSHWSAMLLSWGQQVLEALIAIEICIDQSDRRMYKLQRLSLDDVTVDPQCDQVCLASLDLTLEEVVEDCESQRRDVLQWHASLYAQFLLDLLAQFQVDIDISSPGNDDSGRNRRRLVLGLIERVADERLMQSLRACLTPEDIIRQQDAAVDASMLALMKVALMLCLPPLTRPTLSTVWGLVFRATVLSNDAAIAVQARAFASLTDLQEALETGVLRPLSIVARAFTRQTAASALGSLLELFCAALSRVVALIQRLLSGDDDDISDIVLQAVYSRHVWADVAALALSFFVRFVLNGQRDGAQHAINATIEALRSVLRVVEVAANSTSAPAIWLQQQQVIARLTESVVSAFISIATGQMPEQTGVACITNSTAQQSVLWRLCEPAMQELLERDSAMRRVWAAQRHCLQHLIPITRETDTRLWWSDRDCEDPPRRHATVVPRHDAPCLRYLNELSASLELRFNIAGGVAIPARYRLASLQGCFAPSRLPRRHTDGFVVSDAMNARVWCDLQMQRTFRELLDDTDERIVHAALSVLDAYTRVLRCGFASHLTATTALELAHLLCSPELLVTLARLLTRVVRQLRLLGESGASASRASSYGAVLTAQMTYTSASARSKSPIAVLCVALSYLVNTLHGGERATQHWVSSGILSVILSFARSNVLSFLRVVDANLLLDITGSSVASVSRTSRRSGRGSSVQQQNTEWSVFTVEDTHSARRRTSAGSTNESPFRLLLRELMTHERAPANLSLLQHIRESKRNVQLLLDIAPHEAFTAQLLLNGDVALLCHAAAVMTDMDECEGTLREKVQGLHYARTALGQWLASRRCLRSRDPLSPHLLRVCRLAWDWMETAIASDTAPECSSIAMAALHLLYVVAVSVKLTDAEVSALCRRKSSSGDSIASPQVSQVSIFQSILVLVTSNEGDDQSQATTTSRPRTVAVAFLSAVLHTTTPHGRAILLSVLGVQPFVDVLQCSSAPSSDKLNLWCAMLEICDREMAIAIVNSGFIEKIMTACSQVPTQSSRRDRIEGLLYLEALHYALELLDETTGADALRVELIKCVIHCRTVRSLWHTATSSAAEVPFARRVLQIVCSVCVNQTTGEPDAAVLADLEAAGVMAQVVEWHQARGSDRLIAEATTVRKRIVEFWLAWPKHSLEENILPIPKNPKTSATSEAPAHKSTTSSMMRKPVERPLVAFDLVEPTRNRPVKIAQQLSSQVEQRVRAASTQEQSQKNPMPLDAVLHCVGEHVATLEAVFARYALTGSTSTSRLIPSKRLSFALRDSGIALDPRAVAMDEREALPFSEFLLQYARHSGLESAWTRRSREREWRWVLLPNSEWATISPTQVETLHRKLSRHKGERVISTSDAVRALKSLFLGRLAPPELERLVQRSFCDPMAVDHSDVVDTVSFTDVCRAFLLVQREVDRHGPSQRITLPDATVEAPRETLSPMHSSKRRQQDAVTNADSVVHALLSVDVESAQALAAVDAMKQREDTQRRMKRAMLTKRKERKWTVDASESSDLASDEDTRSVNGDSNSDSDRARSTRRRRRRSSRESKEESHSSAKEAKSELIQPNRRPTRVDAKPVKEDKPLVERQRTNRTFRLKPLTAPAEPKPKLKPDSRVRDREMVALERVFRQYDVDGDGAISFIDLRRALDKRGTCRLSNVELQRWIAEKDTRGAGAVNFEDFVQAFGSVSTTAQSQHQLPDQDGHVERFGRNVDFYS
ncbi:hypothetical protein PINS_up012005 [Pythium insidiosum]|nr:hypothetical protein PINS_up012005 [Pythium insidiosum]